LILQRIPGIPPHLRTGGFAIGRESKMMNFVAMALLLSYLGAVVVFVPESPVEVIPIGSSDEILDGPGVQHTARTGGFPSKF
jgi:hypothetical protein